jgi:hypothetical protein
MGCFMEEVLYIHIFHYYAYIGMMIHTRGTRRMFVKMELLVTPPIMVVGLH